MQPNLSPDAPITTNASGGQQSETGTRFDLIDPKAIFRLAQVLDYGAKRYKADNWRLIPAEDHMNHMVTHLYAWKMGDKSDDHAGHAFCRAMMFLAKVLENDTI